MRNAAPCSICCIPAEGKTLTSSNLLKLLAFRHFNPSTNVEDVEDGVSHNALVPSNRCIVCCWLRVVLVRGPHRDLNIVEVLVQ